MDPDGENDAWKLVSVRQNAHTARHNHHNAIGIGWADPRGKRDKNAGDWIDNETGRTCARGREPMQMTIGELSRPFLRQQIIIYDRP